MAKQVFGCEFTNASGERVTQWYNTERLARQCVGMWKATGARRGFDKKPKLVTKSA